MEQWRGHAQIVGSNQSVKRLGRVDTMSEPLTREQVEKILDSIVEVYEWRHVINYLWENDAALRQQLEAMTAERDDAVRIATELVGLAPITDADIRWAEALLAAKQHQPGVP